MSTTGKEARNIPILRRGAACIRNCRRGGALISYGMKTFPMSTPTVGGMFTLILGHASPSCVGRRASSIVHREG